MPFGSTRLFGHEGQMTVASSPTDETNCVQLLSECVSHEWAIFEWPVGVMEDRCCI